MRRLGKVRTQRASVLERSFSSMLRRSRAVNLKRSFLSEGALARCVLPDGTHSPQECRHFRATSRRSPRFLFVCTPGHDRHELNILLRRRWSYSDCDGHGQWNGKEQNIKATPFKTSAPWLHDEDVVALLAKDKQTKPLPVRLKLLL